MSVSTYHVDSELEDTISERSSKRTRTTGADSGDLVSNIHWDLVEAPVQAEQANRNSDSFRLNAKTIFVTWSKIPDALTKERVLEHAKACFPHAIAQACIVRERHADGSFHIHMWAKYERKLNIRDPRILDIDGCHPNMKAGHANSLKYLIAPEKDKEVDEDPLLYNLTVGEIMAGNKWAYLLSIDDLEEFKKQCINCCPRDFLINGERMIKNWYVVHSKPLPRPPAYFGPFPVSYYTSWNSQTHSLLLYGAPGLGKSQFARYLLYHVTGHDPFIVKGTLEGLKDWKREGQLRPLVIDDISFLNMDEALSREITDVETGTVVNVKHGHVIIPPGIARIFTSNFQFPFRNPGEAVYGRRVTSYEIKEL